MPANWAAISSPAAQSLPTYFDGAVDPEPDGLELPQFPRLLLRSLLGLPGTTTVHSTSRYLYSPLTMTNGSSGLNRAAAPNCATNASVLLSEMSNTWQRLIPPLGEKRCRDQLDDPPQDECATMPASGGPLTARFFIFRQMN